MNDYAPSEQLIALASKMVDGGLAQPELDELHQLLEKDRAAASWLVDWVELNVMLQSDLGSQDPVPLVSRPLLPTNAPIAGPASPTDVANDSPESHSTSVIKPEPRTDCRSRLSSAALAWLAISASLLVIVSYLLGVSRGSHSGDPAGNLATAGSEQAPPQPDIARREVATVSSGVDAVFADGLSLGSRLTPGTVRLQQGVAQVAFDRGAVVVLEGPAELEIVDAETCRLVSGSLSADVLPEAAGFSIAAGGFRISEHDARFGLRAGPRNVTEIHSFGSNLQLVDFRGPVGAVRHLAPGHAVRWEANCDAAEFASNPDAFVTREELGRRRRQNEKHSYSRWVDYSQRWLHDSSVVLRYEFSKSNTDGKFINSVVAGEYLATPRFATPRLISGRWSDKHAMLFDGRTDVLDVDNQEAIQLRGNFSLALWLRTRSFPRRDWTRIVGKGFGSDRNYGLWMDPQGELLWQVCSDSDPQSQEEWDRLSLRSAPMKIGEWQLVVGVVDGDQLMVYVDGELQNSGMAPQEIATSDDPLTIGFYDDVPGHAEYFCGELDELILLNRALAPEEIQQMYDAGKPTLDGDREAIGHDVHATPPSGTI